MPMTNYTVSIALLLFWTVATIVVRYNKPLESNWPIVYWIAMSLISLRYPDNTWDFRYVALGFATALVLRFEFMNRTVANVFKVLEVLVFCYVIWWGGQLLLLI